MYNIYKGKKEVVLNNVTANAVKKYIDFVKGQISGDSTWIKNNVEEQIKELAKGGEVRTTDLVKILGGASERILEGLEMYLNESFVFDWLPIIFKLEESIDEYKKEWTDKLNLDEFIRGLHDFFLRLNPKSTKQVG